MPDDATAVATRIEVKPVTPRIGAVISGVNLENGVSDEVASEIRNALLAHRVVFFREQRLDADQHVGFAQRLGQVTRAHPTLPSSKKNPAVFDLDSQAGAAANHWHTDVTFVQVPPALSILHAIVIPEIGGDTLWANTVAAYEDLRPSIRAMADQLRAVHTNGQDYGRVDVAAAKGNIRPEQLQHLHNFVSTVYETEHPVVRVHPETEERALLLGGFAQKLVGHNSSESVDVLRTLQAYVTRPENTIRWQWREGDVAIWDNRSTQHYAIYDYGSRRRRVQRVTTTGVLPSGLDGRESIAIQGDATDYYSAF
jgi:alpha-ketoglutarate-dependent sulfate ester dioxygenase